MGLELMEGLPSSHMLEEGSYRPGGEEDGIMLSSMKTGGVLMHDPCARMT